MLMVWAINLCGANRDWLPPLNNLIVFFTFLHLAIIAIDDPRVDTQWPVELLLPLHHHTGFIADRTQITHPCGSPPSCNHQRLVVHTELGTDAFAPHQG